MALAIEQKKDGQPAHGFPKLGLTPRERTVYRQGGIIYIHGATPELTPPNPINSATNLFAHSFAQAIRQDITWERIFAQQIPHVPLEGVVHAVLITEPKIDSTSRRIRDIEASIASAKSMMATVNSLGLLLQLRSGIPGKQALKREAKQRAANRAENLKAAGEEVRKSRLKQMYREELSSLKRQPVADERNKETYDQWRLQLREKAEKAHQQAVNLRARLKPLVQHNSSRKHPRI